jgi:hypothetical protein
LDDDGVAVVDVAPWTGKDGIGGRIEREIERVDRVATMKRWVVPPPRSGSSVRRRPVDGSMT